MPWQDPVVYQIYPRSFQDSDGDGVGDLRGIRSRLDHLAWLGVDALWLSPIYPSPLADFGYDISDYEAVDPVYGSLADFDDLAGAAHERGLGLLLDLVPCHTSIEHRWFREHPDWYVWADKPNNWLAAFGGSAWTFDERRGRYYLHSFYPEQPDLDWRNPEVVEAMQGVLRFWLDRGADGFRIDALDRLRKDPQLRDDPPATEPPVLPVHAESGSLSGLYSRNAPDIGEAVGQIRAAVGEGSLVGEIYLPSAKWEPYLAHLDAAFAFELFHAPWDASALRSAIEATVDAAGNRAAWVLSNHDFPRMPTRFGPDNVRVATMMLLTLPGTAFIYQGDEVGMDDGPGHTPPFDRAGRDAHRHPMQWDASPSGGFTSGEPWLPLVDPERRNVADARNDPDSLLHLYRKLIAARRSLGPGFRFRDDAPEGMLAYDRGDRTVLLNTTSAPLRAPPVGNALLQTRADALSAGELDAHSGVVCLPNPGSG
ncbi:MAG TPA: alpha-amylase family glycosyl hydrolase [Thermoleophilaceae bacterium]|nr:alpha-amylase family glycosyl hydrolase [Thermoleophilaceae bacterium]